MESAVGPYDAGKSRCGKGSQRGLDKKGVVLLKSESRKTKKGFWISEDLDEKVDIYLRLDNCASRSEFVENALRFYIGYLNTKNAGGFLPEALSAMRPAKLSRVPVSDTGGKGGFRRRRQYPVALCPSPRFQ